MTKRQQKKAFALAQIGPYIKDNTLCGYDSHEGCQYVTPEGKMCVAGKNMLRPGLFGDEAIYQILSRKTQKEIFRPEAVGILTAPQWKQLQFMHDETAKGEPIERYVKNLNLFTMDELNEYSNSLT